MKVFRQSEGPSTEDLDKNDLWYKQGEEGEELFCWNGEYWDSDFEGLMTIFYSKSTGEIKNYVTGITDMGFYGEDEDDFCEIWDYIVADRDDYVLNNFKQFKIEDSKIKLKENTDIKKYL